MYAHTLCEWEGREGGKRERDRERERERENEREGDSEMTGFVWSELVCVVVQLTLISFNKSGSSN